MPSITGQRIYDSGDGRALELTGGDGSTFTLTKQQIQAFYQSTSGNAAARRAAVIQWLKEQLIAYCGAENLDITKLNYDLDLTSGQITTAEILA